MCPRLLLGSTFHRKHSLPELHVARSIELLALGLPRPGQRVPQAREWSESLRGQVLVTAGDTLEPSSYTESEIRSANVKQGRKTRNGRYSHR